MFLYFELKYTPVVFILIFSSFLSNLYKEVHFPGPGEQDYSFMDFLLERPMMPHPELPYFEIK